MKNNDNARMPGQLFDTTTWDQNTLIINDVSKKEMNSFEPGELITFAGKHVVAATDRPFGIVSNAGAEYIDNKYVVKRRSAQIFSKGRVVVKATGAVAGALAFYKIASKTYGTTGDIQVGSFVTTGENLQVVQVDIKKGAA